MTLVAGLPTSIVVTCRVDGSNHSVPASTGAAVSAVRARTRRCTGLSARCGIGDVALRAVHGDLGVQAAAAADLHHVAEPDGAGRFADQAEVGDLAVLAHPLQHPHGAVDGDAFLVAGDQQADRAVAAGRRRGGRRRRRRRRRWRPSCRRRRGRRARRHAPRRRTDRGARCAAPTGTTSVWPAKQKCGTAGAEAGEQVLDLAVAQAVRR